MKLIITGQQADWASKDLTVSGSDGIYLMEIELNDAEGLPSWASLTAYAVFKSSAMLAAYPDGIAVPINGGRAEIPAAILSEPGMLYVGVYGSNGSVVMPTIWAPAFCIALGCTEGGAPGPTVLDAARQAIKYGENAEVYAEGGYLVTDVQGPIEDPTLIREDTYTDGASDYADAAAASATAAEGSKDAAALSAQAASDSKDAAALSAGAAASSATDAANAKTAAETASQAVQDMSVDATTLTPGSEATATKEVDPDTGAVTIHYGIPAGHDGTSFPTDYLFINNDDGIFGFYANSDPQAGAAVEFSDGADGIKLKSITVAVEPVQAGSGDPSPTNPRPITGWTGAEISVGASASDPSPTAYNIDWSGDAGTVYGGTLVYMGGGSWRLTVDRAGRDIGGILSMTYNNNGYFLISKGEIVPAAKTGTGNAYLCSIFRQASAGSGNYFVYETNGQIRIVDTDYNNADNFRAAMAGQYLTYPLATPQVYDLTANDVLTLLGANFIKADTGALSNVVHRIGTTAVVIPFEAS